MSDRDRLKRDREAAAKLAQKRIQNVEKHFGDICSTVGSITRKNARLRDKGDLLARNLIAYAESEKLNPTTRSCVLQFAENYAAVQDYNNAKVQRLETKVLKPLTKYGEKCRFVKRGIKSEITVCGKEKKTLQKLEKLQEKSESNQSQIAQVEIELEKVQGEEQIVGEAMEMEVDKFEQDKLLDFKSVLTELVKIEMLYHAKALEYLSKCFENTQQIDTNTDFEEYRAEMSKPNNSSNPPASSRSQKQGADAATLTSTGLSTTGTVSSLSADTRASGTFSSTALSSLSRSRQPQSARQQQPSRPVQPSPRSRQPSVGRPSPRVRISSTKTSECTKACILAPCLHLCTKMLTTMNQTKRRTMKTTNTATQQT